MAWQSTTSIALRLALRASVHWTLANPRSYDNAPIESFSGEEHCSARKNELVYHQEYQTRMEAISDIVKYIELEYNEERLAKHCFAATQGKSCARSGTRIQKGLGMKSPRQVWFDYYRQAA